MHESADGRRGHGHRQPFEGGEGRILAQVRLGSRVSGLRVLFIGGSGIISSACSRLAVERGLDVYALNRGATSLRPLPSEVSVLHGDVRDANSVGEALSDREFDVVVNWVAFTPDHVEADLERFRGRIGQYIFISSASAYQTPPSRVPITESTPLSNPVLAVLTEQDRL